jgi:dynein heavy chain
LPEFEYSKDTPYFELLVPTVDTTKFSYILERMLEIEKATLFTGGTGVGKSVFINNLLFRLKEANGVISIMLNCSAQTKARDTQLAIEAKLHKKGKTLFGSRPNESIAIFIDDINMPALEFYGAQPTI